MPTVHQYLEIRSTRVEWLPAQDDLSLHHFNYTPIEKQIDKLIRAFAKLDTALDARLEIVGGGELEGKLKALAQSLKVSDRVKFAGFVDEAYLRNALTRASVFAMPSIGRRTCRTTRLVTIS